MTEIDKFREILQLCENFKVEYAKVGEIEVRMAPERPDLAVVPQMDPNEYQKQQERRELETKYAHTGFIPNFPSKRS